MALTRYTAYYRGSLDLHRVTLGTLLLSYSNCQFDVLANVEVVNLDTNQVYLLDTDITGTIQLKEKPAGRR